MERSVRELTLATLTELEPRISALFNKKIQRAVRDCREAPEEGKAREVKFKLEITPIFEHGECIDVHVQIFIDDKVPVKRTRQFRLGATKKDQLFFCPDNPEDITQRGLGFDGDDEGGSS